MAWIISRSSKEKAEIKMEVLAFLIEERRTHLREF
jgi:hypothetical protein